MNTATAGKASGIIKKEAQVRHSFFIPIKEIYGFTQEHAFPSPLPRVPEIHRQGSTNESRRDKETVNLVSKIDSSAVPLFTKKRGTWPWTEGLGCSEENPTMSYFLQKTADMRTSDVNRRFGTTFDKNNHSVTDRVGRVYATHRRCSGPQHNSQFRCH